MRHSTTTISPTMRAPANGSSSPSTICPKLNPHSMQKPSRAEEEDEEAFGGGVVVISIGVAPPTPPEIAVVAFALVIVVVVNGMLATML